MTHSNYFSEMTHKTLAMRGGLCHTIYMTTTPGTTENFATTPRIRVATDSRLPSCPTAQLVGIGTRRPETGTLRKRGSLLSPLPQLPLSLCEMYEGRLDKDGYPINVGGKRFLRVKYEAVYGPIPAGMVLDHICHTLDEHCAGGRTCLHRRCVNLDHVELVTHVINTLRGRNFAAVNSRKTHCPKGHPYDEFNTQFYVGRKLPERHCRECMRQRNRGA